MKGSRRTRLKKVAMGDVVTLVAAPPQSEALRRPRGPATGETIGTVLIARAGAHLVLGYFFFGDDLSSMSPTRAANVRLFSRQALAGDDYAGEVRRWDAFAPANWPIPLFAGIDLASKVEGPLGIVYSDEVERLGAVTVPEAMWRKLPSDGWLLFPAQSLSGIRRRNESPPMIVDAAEYAGRIGARAKDREGDGSLSVGFPIPASAVNDRVDEQHFWELIGAARASAKDDDEAFLVAVRQRLRALAPAALAQFRRHLDLKLAQAFRWDVWGAAYLLEGGCSDDAFEYFRCWLVSLGQKPFERVLKEPDALAEFAGGAHRMHELEEFQYLPAEVFEEKSDGDFYEEVEKASVNDPQHPGAPVGKQWVEEELPKMFPRIAKLVRAH